MNMMKSWTLAALSWSWGGDGERPQATFFTIPRLGFPSVVTNFSRPGPRSQFLNSRQYQFNILLRVLKTYVRPLLEFNTPVWNPWLFKDIEHIEISWNVQVGSTEMDLNYGIYMCLHEIIWQTEHTNNIRTKNIPWEIPLIVFIDVYSNLKWRPPYSNVEIKAILFNCWNEGHPIQMLKLRPPYWNGETEGHPIQMLNLRPPYSNGEISAL